MELKWPYRWVGMLKSKEDWENTGEQEWGCDGEMLIM